MKKKYIIVTSILILSVVISLTVNRENTQPKLRKLHFKARQYNYDPHRVVVNRGDTLQISLESLDVTHGFYLLKAILNINQTENQPVFKAIDSS